jgi:soluble lytic murein transglycosylase-like protein
LQSAARRAAPLLLTGLLLIGLAPDIVSAEPPAQGPQFERGPSADPYAGYIAEAVRRFGLPASWIRAVIHAESGGDRDAVSPAGARGLMQIMPMTWSALRARHGLGADPFDARDNILAGTAYLSELHDRFGAPGLFAAYNAGPSRYADHLTTGRPLPAETHAFVAAMGRALTGSGTAKSNARGPVGRDGWTRAALFIARDGNRAITPSLQTGASSESRTTAPKPHALDAVTPRASGLFVSRSAQERP